MISIKLFWLFCSLSLSFLFSSNAYAGPKEDYELQERCGKRAEERYKQEVGNPVSSDKDSTYLINYTNHYNKRLNKCFMLITTNSYPKDKSRDIITIKTLIDINENKEYGNLVKIKNAIMTCEVANKQCKSENEWENLVRPFMEE
jgi:hypothetical protein